MPPRATLYCLLLTALLCGPAAPGVAAAGTNFAAIAERILVTARTEWQAAPTNAALAAKFAAASFDRAEFAANDTDRATLAVAAIQAMRQLLARDPKSAPGHYYLAMNLGQLARTKTLGALSIVDEMEQEFKTARDLDEQLDHAGPDRNLGQLYFQAPGWPASVGSNTKARKHLERAVALAPEFPDNHLSLLEAAVSWKDKKTLRTELLALPKLWPAAQTNFTGDQWLSSWADWEKRRASFTTSAQAILSK